MSQANKNPDTNDSTAPTVSRRTGLDRRWIVSPNHQPERRRGKDRRAERKRSFTDSLVLAEPEKKEARNTGLGTETPKMTRGQTIFSPDESMTALFDGSDNEVTDT